MTTKPSDANGLVCRQLLPFGMGASKTYTRDFHWVTWHAEPITLEEARAHLGPCGGMCAVVVRCQRGPKGGWIGAAYITHPADLPKQSQLSGKLHPEHASHVTLYYGWKDVKREALHYYQPMDDGLYRSHLILHA